MVALNHDDSPRYGLVRSEWMRITVDRGSKLGLILDTFQDHYLNLQHQPPGTGSDAATSRARCLLSKVPGCSG